MPWCGRCVKKRSGQPQAVDVSYSEFLLIFVMVLETAGNLVKCLNYAYPGFDCGQGKATDNNSKECSPSTTMGLRVLGMTAGICPVVIFGSLSFRKLSTDIGIPPPRFPGGPIISSAGSRGRGEKWSTCRSDA